jgi:tetratricopeptide (TPR) repeat protein
LLGQHKENLAVKIVKIQLLLNLGKLDDAKTLYQDSQFEKVNPALQSGLEGRIAFLEKNYVVALKKLAPFYKAYPSSQNAMLVALAQKQAQKGDEAIQTLKTFLKANDSDTQVRSLLASFYLEQQPEKSIPLYERMLKDSPENVVFLNNLAWLNLENNNLELALKYSSEAIKLAPKHPSVLDTRGMILLKSGDKNIALKALTSAFELSRGTDINIVLNYAEVLIANDKNDEARKILRRLKPEDPEQNVRLKLLKSSAN